LRFVCCREVAREMIRRGIARGELRDDVDMELMST
jgi:hypothetical protein